MELTYVDTAFDETNNRYSTIIVNMDATEQMEFGLRLIKACPALVLLNIRDELRKLTNMAFAIESPEGKEYE